MGLAQWIRDLKLIVKLYPDVKSIARRMFVTNSLDGIIAALGVNVGGYSPGGDPILLASSIMGGSVAMGLISAMLGVYLSEKAERLREYRELEKSLASSLKSSIHWKAVNIVPLYIAFWSGLGILLFPLVISLPYFMAAAGTLSMGNAYIASLLAALSSMGYLGYYLARVSGENPVRGVARVLGMGLLAILIVKLLRLAIA